MERVGIYNRCSTEEEAQINALGIQAEESREIAVRNGWVITEQYIESESGTGTQKRSQYQRLFEDMGSDKFDIVMIKSIDRLMRSAKDWYLFLDRLTCCHKKLYIYIEHKFYTPEDGLITGIKAILAEDFSRELSKKIKNSHRRRQEKQTGLNITVPMFGWDKVAKDVYEINREEAKAYKMAFEMVREGYGFYSVAKYMYEMGVRGKNGKRISDVQWRKMIYSPRAHGTVVLHRKEYDFETKRTVRVPESEWIYIEDALPAIVSRQYQEEVLKILAERKEEQPGRENQNEEYRSREDQGKECHGKDHPEKKRRNMSTAGRHMLSGKLYCRECGEVYYRTSYMAGGKKMILWKCSRAINGGRKACNNINVREENVLQMIDRAYKEKFGDMSVQEDDLAEVAFQMIEQAIAECSGCERLKKYEEELEEYGIKKKILLEKLIDGIISDEDFRDYQKALAADIEAVNKKLEEERRNREDKGMKEKRLSKIRKALGESVIARAGMRELAAAVHRIHIHKDGKAEIIFETSRLRSLTGNCGEGEKGQESDDTFYKAEMLYSHKKAENSKNILKNS